MSQENVEIARRMMQCVNSEDDEGLAALMSSDVECFPSRDQPEPSFRGREAFLRYALSWTEAFDYYAVEGCEYTDLGEYVLVVGRTVARGRGSGAVTSTEGDAWLLRFRDGSAVEYREYATKAEALEAVGLSE
jgi:ketosteroid isomerase-like protein